MLRGRGIRLSSPGVVIGVSSNTKVRCRSILRRNDLLRLVQRNRALGKSLCGGRLDASLSDLEHRGFGHRVFRER